METSIRQNDAVQFVSCIHISYLVVIACILTVYQSKNAKRSPHALYQNMRTSLGERERVETLSLPRRRVRAKKRKKQEPRIPVPRENARGSEPSRIPGCEFVGRNKRSKEPRIAVPMANPVNCDTRDDAPCWVQQRVHLHPQHLQSNHGFAISLINFICRYT